MSERVRGPLDSPQYWEAVREHAKFAREHAAEPLDLPKYRQALLEAIDETEFDRDEVFRQAWNQFRQLSFSELLALESYLSRVLEEETRVLDKSPTFQPLPLDVLETDLGLAMSKQKIHQISLVDRITCRKLALDKMLRQIAIFGEAVEPMAPPEDAAERNLFNRRIRYAYIALFELGKTFDSPRDMMREIEEMEADEDSPAGKSGSTVYQYFRRHFQVSGEPMPKTIGEWKEYVRTRQRSDVTMSHAVGDITY